MLARILRTVMTSEAAVRKVPIPRRGVDYRGKVVLAPMVRSGELPSRLLALHYGADLVWGPETVDKAMIGTTRRFNPATGTIEWTRLAANHAKSANPDGKEAIIYRVHPEKEGRRLVFQIGTSDPERAVEAARLVAADVAGIDVNAGCPKPFSISGGMGAALLRKPDLLCAILEALVREIPPRFDIGISVKIRLLETAAETEALVRRLLATGITGLTVHCRTTPMRPRERAIRGQLRMIAELCREAGVACLMNGDVESRDHALQLIDEYGVDGAMIATAAEANPSCFRTAADGGLAPWEEVAERYLRLAMSIDNHFSNTKYLLCQIVPGKKGAGQAMYQARSYADTCEVLGLEHLADEARALDVRLGIDPDTKKAAKSGTDKKKNAVALAAGGNMADVRPPHKTLSERGAGLPAGTSRQLSPPPPQQEPLQPARVALSM